MPPRTPNTPAAAPMPIPALAPPERALVDVEAEVEEVVAAGEVVVVSLEPVGEVVGDEVGEVVVDETDEVAPRVAARTTTLFVPQQVVFVPQHQSVEVGVPSHGVMRMFPY
jgi:hypothetical protein